MKRIEIDTYDVTNKGIKKRGKKIVDVEDKDVRHNDLCTICGFPSYPECTTWCQHYEPPKKDSD